MEAGVRQAAKSLTSRGLSAAGRGCDGALKVAQRTVGRVDRDRDWEVEDSGSGGASVQHSHGRAPSFS